VRRTALFWLGQEASEAATAGLADIAKDEDGDREIRATAIFALSQRPEEEGVPILMDLARTAREPDTRKTAFFWLAQSHDARVIPFFREVLLRGRGG
jgi:HEAT repeat protein